MPRPCSLTPQHFYNSSFLPPLLEPSLVRLAGQRNSVSHHRRLWTHARRGHPHRRSTNGAQLGASAACLIFRLPSYYRWNMDECLRWVAERRQPSSHIQPVVMSGKLDNIIIRNLHWLISINLFSWHISSHCRHIGNFSRKKTIMCKFLAQPSKFETIKNVDPPS